VKVRFKPRSLLHGSRIMVGDTRSPEERCVMAGRPGVVIRLKGVRTEGHGARWIEDVDGALIGTVPRIREALGDFACRPVWANERKAFARIVGDGLRESF